MPPGVREAVWKAWNNLFFIRTLLQAIKKRTGGIQGRKQNIFMRQRWGRSNIPIGIRLRPKKALVTAPAFAEYEEALVQAGTEIVFHELGELP